MDHLLSFFLFCFVPDTPWLPERGSESCLGLLLQIFHTEQQSSEPSQETIDEDPEANLSQILPALPALVEGHCGLLQGMSEG